MDEGIINNNYNKDNKINKINLMPNTFKQIPILVETDKQNLSNLHIINSINLHSPNKLSQSTIKLNNNSQSQSTIRSLSSSEL